MSHLVTYQQHLGLGDAGTDLDAAIARWRQQLAGKADEIRAKYTVARPAGELQRDLTHWRQVAEEFARVGPTLSSITAASVERARQHVSDLRYLEAYIGQLSAGQLVTRQSLVDRAVAAMVAPIEWLISIGTPVLVTDANYRKAIDNALSPSSWLRSLLDGLRKSLSLPSWFVPVAATAALGGAGYLAWKWLAPPRLLRNPRRRRR